ncbi:zinc finger protein 277 isoform X2 [Ischnura elegans]|uniref:zinc finger protein 277 isoform X2 n=1 Tax=Ischnura elegans TaxID=197161 RepID=UPI001ED86EC5|nr:zinc finger protein 277 isoform X2 [Ischnura elegans]
MEGKQDCVQHQLSRNTSVYNGPLPDPLINFDPLVIPSVPCLAPCIFCDEHFPLDEDGKDIALLQHMFFQHRLVIADSEHIASLCSYCQYWKARLLNHPPSEFFFGVNVDANPAAPSPRVVGSYFLLSDQLPEDRVLREGLQKKRLEWALRCQEWERADESFERTCLFCKEAFSGKGARLALLSHLSKSHNLQLGHPHNLVFIDVLLEKLQNTLNEMLCIYCGKKFTDWFVLKEHMRKKQHKRVNPKDPTFDRFYIVNYLERGKGWQDIQGERDVEDRCVVGGSGASEGEGSNDPCGDWSDWEEEAVAEESRVHCLFCTFKGNDLVSIVAHMREDHCGFDLLTFNDRRFYSLVKIVNFIRKRVQEGRCIVCEWPCEGRKERTGEGSSGDIQALGQRRVRGEEGAHKEEGGEGAREALLQHMSQCGHFACPTPKLWDWPELVVFLPHLRERCLSLCAW